MIYGDLNRCKLMTLCAATYQIEMASTGIRGFGKRPVITTSIIKYQNSKLQFI